MTTTWAPSPCQPLCQRPTRRRHRSRGSGLFREGKRPQNPQQVRSALSEDLSPGSTLRHLEILTPPRQPHTPDTPTPVSIDTRPDTATPGQTEQARRSSVSSHLDTRCPMSMCTPPSLAVSSVSSVPEACPSETGPRGQFGPRRSPDANESSHRVVWVLWPCYNTLNSL